MPYRQSIQNSSLCIGILVPTLAVNWQTQPGAIKPLTILPCTFKKKDLTIKGFNRRNLYRMRQFFEAYANNEIVTPLVTQISWTHHLIILSRTKTDTEREFYLRLCIKERYSKRELERQINAAVYERTMLSKENAILSLPLQDTTGICFKDSYVFEFLGLPESHSEHELQKALIKHLKLFILELGKDFIFVGEEFKVQVGNAGFLC
jgi:predicted nuclease of restriction endonuclease-like (RecB) superfamily